MAPWSIIAGVARVVVLMMTIVIGTPRLAAELCILKVESAAVRILDEGEGNGGDEDGDADKGEDDGYQGQCREV